MEFYEIVIVVIGVFLILFVLIEYNSLIKLNNNVKRAKGVIDVYLKQRFDLIPNLVECVKGYSKYENETINNIIENRSKYLNSKTKDLEEAEKLNNDMNNFLALAESYPDLKASEQYLYLQKKLTKVESQLQAARRIYNNDVLEYNTKVEVVPSNIIAKIFGFKITNFFEINESERDNIKIKVDD